jgi:hypothetical protein
MKVTAMKWSTDELRKIAASDDLYISPFRDDGLTYGTSNDRIDDGYRAKYANSPYLKPMISARARSATVRVLPNS